MNAHSFKSKLNLGLVPFPDHQAAELQKLYQIKAQTHLEPTALSVQFLLLGQLHFVETPFPVLQPQFRDELWKNTCFEVFVGHEGRPGYLEVNASPSGDWASYIFKSYRQREESPQLHDRQFKVAISSEFITHNEMTLDIKIPRTLLDEAIPHFNVAGLRLGLSTVLEDRRHHLSYWALQHHSAAPDFHRSECFAHAIVGAGKKP